MSKYYNALRMHETNEKRRVIFHRFFNIYNGGTSGGQLKVRDSFEHVKSSPNFIPKVFFNEETKWFDNPGNVWRSLHNSTDELKELNLKPDDILFFAGIDWMMLNENDCLNPPVPVVNIAHPRHTDANDKRNAFLKYPAIRITKSSLSKKILDDYGVNGPVYVIPDAIDPSELPAVNQNPEIDILIVGLKNPVLAEKIYRKLKFRNWLKGRKMKIEIQKPPKLPTRRDFLDLMNNARIIVYLPLEEKYGSEGFYLPALEGMFLKKLVICPFAIGNVDFCLDGKTCIMPEYNAKGILRGIERVLAMTEAERHLMIKQASEITQNHLLENERESLLELLNNVDDIWNQKNLFWKSE